MRQIHASLRDTWLLLREFKWPLLAFILATVGGGLLYQKLTNLAGGPSINIPEAIYHILGLTFLQPTGDFPDVWYLELFYFIMPVIGLVILSQGIAEFGTTFFNRHQRAKEWEMAVATTYTNHHVLVGLGHLGYRVVSYLHDLGQDVVVIELNPSADLVANVKRMGIPVIQDDAKREATLEGAGISRARSIILCTQNDSMNLQVALKARRINERIHVLVRIFDEEFARALKDQFGFTAFSATQMAAPIFASVAAGVEITQPITVDGRPFNLAQLKISPRSKIIGLNIGYIEQSYEVSIVLLRRNHQSNFHPPAHIIIQENDDLAILGEFTEISHFIQENL